MFSGGSAHGELVRGGLLFPTCSSLSDLATEEVLGLDSLSGPTTVVAEDSIESCLEVRTSGPSARRLHCDSDELMELDHTDVWSLALCMLAHV